MRYFYFIIYILAVSPNGCFWKMPYPVSPYAYPRLSVPVSVLLRLEVSLQRDENLELMHGSYSKQHKHHGNNKLTVTRSVLEELSTRQSRVPIQCKLIEKICQSYSDLLMCFSYYQIEGKRCVLIQHCKLISESFTKTLFSRLVLKR